MTALLDGKVAIVTGGCHGRRRGRSARRCRIFGEVANEMAAGWTSARD